jgi:hypothetical protein
MPLPRRFIAFSSAVIGFFALGLVGVVGGLSPSTCCKRALLGSALLYVIASAAVGTVNMILTHAMIASQMNKDRTGVNGS